MTSESGLDGLILLKPKRVHVITRFRDQKKVRGGSYNTVTTGREYK